MIHFNSERKGGMTDNAQEKVAWILYLGTEPLAEKSLKPKHSGRELPEGGRHQLDLNRTLSITDI